MARGVLLSPVMKTENNHRDRNQGEGDRLSARHYDRHVRDFVEGGKVEPAAQDAARFVDEHPEEAARAERATKRGPRSVRASIDELIAKGQAVVDRVRPVVERAVDKVKSRLERK